MADHALLFSSLPDFIDSVVGSEEERAYTDHLLREYNALIVLERAIRRFRRDSSNIVHYDIRDALRELDEARHG